MARPTGMTRRSSLLCSRTPAASGILSHMISEVNNDPRRASEAFAIRLPERLRRQPGTVDTVIEDGLYVNAESRRTRTSIDIGRSDVV